MTEREARAALGEVYERLAHHIAPPLLEDLCQCVAFVVNEAVKGERGRGVQVAARYAETTLNEAEERAANNIAEAIRARSD